MKSILLNDPEWNWFIDALVFSELSFDSTIEVHEEGQEFTIPVSFDGGTSDSTYGGNVLDGGQSNSVYPPVLADGIYEIITPGVTSGGTNKLLVYNGEYNFDSIPEGVDTVTLQQLNIIISGEEGINLSARLMKNLTTSYSNVMLLTALSGLPMADTKILPEESAAFTYQVRIFKVTSNGKTILCCAPKLYPSESGNTDVIRYGGVNYTVVSYNKGVLETSPTLTLANDYEDVVLTRTLANYYKGFRNFVQESSSELVKEGIEFARPLVEFVQEYTFNLNVASTVILSNYSSNSPFILSVFGNDSFTLTLIQVDTQSGDGISLHEGGTSFTGVAPTDILIDFGDNLSDLQNSARLKIVTEHCGTFTVNLIQPGINFKLQTQFFTDGQVVSWYNLNQTLETAYRNVAQSFGSPIKKSTFNKPAVKITPFDAFSVDFQTSPYGLNSHYDVNQDQFVPFDIDLSDSSESPWEDLTTQDKVSSEMKAIVEVLDITYTASLYVKVVCFAFSTNPVLNYNVFSFKQGPVTLPIKIYTNLATSAVLSRLSVSDGSSILVSTTKPSSKSGFCEYTWNVQVKETTEGMFDDSVALISLQGFRAASLNFRIIRQHPKISSLIITAYGPRRTPSYFVFQIWTNFVNPNILVHFGSMAPRNVRVRMSEISSNVNLENTGNQQYLESTITPNGVSGWGPTYQEMLEEFDRLFSYYNYNISDLPNIPVTITYLAEGGTGLDRNIDFGTAIIQYGT